MRLGAGAAVIFGLVGTAVLIGLGVWQIQRMTWKEGLIAELELRMSQDPVAVPSLPDAKRDEFLRVAVMGSLDGRALHVLTSQAPWGPGFRVIAPLTDPAGRTVLVDVGFVPEVLKDTNAQPAGSIEVVGALYWPDETDGFTPPPDRAANIWFARDLAAMAEALGTEPLMIVAEWRGGADGGGDWPKPLRLGLDLPNDHLQYALTWFSLGLIWAVMSAMLVQRERRRLG